MRRTIFFILGLILSVKALALEPVSQLDRVEIACRPRGPLVVHLNIGTFKNDGPAMEVIMNSGLKPKDREEIRLATVISGDDQNQTFAVSPHHLTISKKRRTRDGGFEASYRFYNTEIPLRCNYQQ